MDSATTTEGTIRCPECSGLNKAGAEWCGQCLTRFTPPPPPGPDHPADVRGVDESLESTLHDLTMDTEWIDDPPQPEHHSSLGAVAGLIETGFVPLEEALAPPVISNDPIAAPPSEMVGLKRGAFEVTEAGVQWTCAKCDALNSIDRQVCSVCGTTFAQTVIPEEEKPARDPGAAAMWSLFLPGAGHAYLGQWGQAIARGVLSMWALAVVGVAALQGSAGGARVIAIVFGLVATALWVVDAHDAYREANHEPSLVVLKGKMFFYLVIVLLGLLMSMLVLSFLKAQGAG